MLESSCVGQLVSHGFDKNGTFKLFEGVFVQTHQTSSASTSHSAPNWQISQVDVSFCPASAEPSPPKSDRKRQRKTFNASFIQDRFVTKHFLPETIFV